MATAVRSGLRDLRGLRRGVQEAECLRALGHVEPMQADDTIDYLTVCFGMPDAKAREIMEGLLRNGLLRERPDGTLVSPQWRLFD